MHETINKKGILTTPWAKADNIVMGYWGLVLPSSLGGVSDLAHDAALGNLVKKFVAANSNYTNLPL